MELEVTVIVNILVSGITLIKNEIKLNSGVLTFIYQLLPRDMENFLFFIILFAFLQNVAQCNNVTIVHPRFVMIVHTIVFRVFLRLPELILQTPFIDFFLRFSSSQTRSDISKFCSGITGTSIDVTIK